MSQNNDRAILGLVRAAMCGAAILLAQQVAAKAVRDSLFLDTFSATDLPKVVGTAAILAVLSGLAFARGLLRRRPASILIWTLCGSALLHLLEFFLIARFREPVVVFCYLHIMSASSIALSLFWSVANEAFSPGEAKKYFGRITAAGTVGGVAGGLLAARAASWFSIDSLLILLAVFQAAAIFAVMALNRERPTPHGEDPEGFISTVRGAVQRAPFLKALALLVLLSTVSSAIVDFLFKSGASRTYGRGPELAEFFAYFYTATQAASFLLQVAVTPHVLRLFGLGRTVTALPGALAIGGLASLWTPVLVAFGSTRLGDAILRGSLFRAGYELFFTAIPASERRSVKIAIDVGCDRMGELVAAAIIQIFLLMGSDATVRPLLVVVTVFAFICIRISLRMDTAYLHALEQGLLHRAIELKSDDIQDSTTFSAFMNSLPQIPAAQMTPATAPRAASADQPTIPRPVDPSLDRLRVLRSGIAPDVQKALSLEHPFDPLTIPQIIRLLAWDEVTVHARQHLEHYAARVGGQLADAMLDSNQDFSIRRRLPRILVRVPSQRTVEMLTEVLDDPRFELRFQSSRALEMLHRSNTALQFDETRLMEVVERELSVSRTIWEGRRLLDKRDETDSQFAFLDEVLQDRAHQSLEHVFSLLAISLPREPLKVAFRALHSDDRLLRGLGLEYLETAMPAGVFRLFSAMIEPDSQPVTGRPAHDALQALMASQQSIQMQLRIASGDAPEPSPQPRPTTNR
ncbi:MAG: hypothetical protein ABIR70_07695 [Bryobacteraceae bacterium]